MCILTVMTVLPPPLLGELLSVFSLCRPDLNLPDSWVCFCPKSWEPSSSRTALSDTRDWLRAVDQLFCSLSHSFADVCVFPPADPPPLPLHLTPGSDGKWWHHCETMSVRPTRPPVLPGWLTDSAAARWHITAGRTDSQSEPAVCLLLPLTPWHWRQPLINQTVLLCVFVHHLYVCRRLLKCASAWPLVFWVDNQMWLIMSPWATTSAWSDCWCFFCKSSGANGSKLKVSKWLK